MHTDSEMTGISHSGSMHYMTAASLEMSDEPFFLMRLRFQRAIIPPLLRTLPILQCFSLLDTSMPLLPCPNLAEVVAVPFLSLAGAKRMTRTNAPLLADAY